MGRGRCFEGQFAAGTITRPGIENKIAAARWHLRGAGWAKLGHPGALLPGRVRQAVGAPKYSHSLCPRNLPNRFGGNSGGWGGDDPEPSNGKRPTAIVSIPPSVPRNTDRPHSGSTFHSANKSCKHRLM
jgi:hypothetical protein